MEAHPGHNQRPYNLILDGLSRSPSTKINDLRLDLDLFPNGKVLERRVGKDPVLFSNAVAVHFNLWTGLDDKRKAMITYGKWIIDDVLREKNGTSDERLFPL
jgi:hypothetical protein